MKCPYCKNENTKVIDSRNTKGSSEIRRRRECIECNSRFTTYENIVLEPLMVIKKDGTREDFDREKLTKGILKACTKRNISMDQITILVNKTLKSIQSMNLKEVPTHILGDIVLDLLLDLDDIAYIRYASIYKDIQTIEEFKNELSVITNGNYKDNITKYVI